MTKTASGVFFISVLKIIPFVLKTECDQQTTQQGVCDCLFEKHNRWNKLICKCIFASFGWRGSPLDWSIFNSRERQYEHSSSGAHWCFVVSCGCCPWSVCEAVRGKKWQTEYCPIASFQMLPALELAIATQGTSKTKSSVRPRYQQCRDDHPGQSLNRCSLVTYYCTAIVTRVKIKQKLEQVSKKAFAAESLMQLLVTWCRGHSYVKQ